MTPFLAKHTERMKNAAQLRFHYHTAESSRRKITYATSVDYVIGTIRESLWSVVSVNPKLKNLINICENLHDGTNAYQLSKKTGHAYNFVWQTIKEMEKTGIVVITGKFRGSKIVVTDAGLKFIESVLSLKTFLSKDELSKKLKKSGGGGTDDSIVYGTREGDT